LMSPSEMFELPHTDLFSEYRNFLTGIELCVSELRGRRDRRPVRLDIGLPPSQIDAGLEQRMTRTIRRYCGHRMQYNRSERQATRLGGISALRVGLPIAAAGLLLTALAVRLESDGSVAQLIEDHIGWVLAWIG